MKYNFKEGLMAAKVRKKLSGLYANIHAKQARIAAGSGEKRK